MVCNAFDDPESALESGRKLAHPEPGEEIVISGTAGIFPDSENLADFADKLFNKVDLISDDDRRWKLDHPEIPHRTGKLLDISHFDAAFFGIHYKQAHTMDPMCRLLLEKTYETVIDAGYNPRSLYGSRIGVFIGACFSESEKTWLYEKLQVNGFGITGCSRAMLANRVSYWLGVDGPSYTVDSACSSSMYALEHGYRAIRDGECDAAIVGGCNLCLHPHVSLQFARLGVLSMDGRCKSFDEAANGYCRSEAISVMFLQKKKDARRIYATLVHAKTNCDGYKEQGITFPSGPQQQVLLRDFYNECQIDPSTLAWVEAHGTGTKVGDPEEVKALENIFCEGREKPLKIGSVKSNIGHSEPASGVCSISKVIIAMETGFIPPNINFTKPKSDIEAFHNGKITVITEKTPWEGGLVGVNSFGFGGANGHVLLKWNEKGKVNGGMPKDDLPRLVGVSGRTEEAVDYILTYLETHPLDAEFVKMFHEIHKTEIPGHHYRGYTILNKSREVARDIEYYPGKKRQVWYIFSGCCSEWDGMAWGLTAFPVFNEAVQKCQNALKQYKIDIFTILGNPKSDFRNRPLHSVLAVTTVQIGLISLLKTVGLSPDRYFGTSFGEIACAYLDGALTAEEAILTAYHMGVVFQQQEDGSMALIGMDKEDLLKTCPKDVHIVCQYGDNSMVSGPANSVRKLTSDMKRRNITVAEISSNSACHTHLIKNVRPALLKNLEKVIVQPKVQSDSWISTAVTKTGVLNKLNAEYFCNNLTGDIKFEEVVQRIPYDAIVIEVSPSGILKNFIEDSLHKSTYISLMDKNDNNDVKTLLSSLGKIFECGGNLDLAQLYPEVSYPVSRSTPMIAPLVKWDHSEDWYVTTYKTQDKIKSGERPVSINLKNEDAEYITGHNIDGRVLFPATGYLVLVWETIGLMRGELYSDIPVVFENVRFLRATNMVKDGPVDFVVMVQKVSGNFEVVEGDVAVVTGRIYVPDDIEKETSGLDITPPNDEELILSPKDIYKEFRLRGYNYKGLFRGLAKADEAGVNGRIQWRNNWVPFMDNMLQMILLSGDTRGLFVPTYIERVVIDPKKHTNIVNSLPDDTVPVYANKEMELIISGGVEVRNLQCTVIQRRKPLGEPVIEKHVFTPYSSTKQDMEINDVVRMLTQLALENHPTLKVKVVELADSLNNPEGPLLAPIIAQALGDLPLIQAEITILTSPNNPLVADINSEISVEEKKIVCDQSVLIVTASNILGESSSEKLQSCLGAIKDGGFIIAREKPDTDIKYEGLTKWAEYHCCGEIIISLKKDKQEEKNYEVIYVKNDEFSWLAQLQNGIKNEAIHKIYLVSENECHSGILGLTNCIRKETGSEKVRAFFLMDPEAPTFSLENPFYLDQAKKDLVTNILRKGEWGSYCHLPLNIASRVTPFHAYVNVTTRGDLASLRWIQGHVTNPDYKLMDHQEIVHVCYSALNFRDIMTATAKIAPEVVAETRLQLECVQGLEYSGIDKSGRRVMGMTSNGGLASIVVADKPLMWRIPDEWTLEEAATVPVVYGTVTYALLKFGRLTRGETILIHAGSGGVGLAAIHLAYFYGLDIFTTVGTKEKREFLKKQFPQLTDNRIGNSRDTSFEQLIMKETNGRGVDIVLNSLSEEKLLASVRCLAPGGRFLEIGKFDLANNNQLGMDLFTDGRSFQGIMLDKLLNARPEEKMKFTHLLDDALEAGAIVPLPRTTFQSDEIEQAFRYMATGKHAGKILVKIRDLPSNILKPDLLLIPAIPRFYCDPNKSYIIVGGMGGFGLELADWLVLRGAKNLILSSRTGLKNGYQSYRIKIWKAYGVRVCISTWDITTNNGVQALLKDASSFGPVGGIFNLAVVLRDALLENQTESDFKISLAPKATATHYFDIYSRTMCPQLEQFVVFSSVSCGRGNMGQTNYGMANSIMERICEARAADGLPALAVQWGAVGDVGLVAEMQEENTEIIIGGTLQQQISSCLQVLDLFMNQKQPVVSSMVVAEKRVGAGSSESIVDTVANILGLRDLKTVSLHSTLAELGMDSMMAVEIKQTLEREFEVFLTPQDIRSMTFSKLHEYSVTDKSINTNKPSGAGESKGDFGLNFLIRVIGDEKNFEQPLVRLESKCRSDPEHENTNISNPIFVFPGIEGRSSIIDPIAKNLNFPVFGLQLDPKCNTIEDIAISLTKNIKKYLAPKASFNIVGYSFGGVVAVEVVKLLEADGHIGKLCLIDSSPEFIKGVIKLAVLGKSENQVQENVIEHFIHLLWPEYTSQLNHIMKQDISLENKIQAIVDASPYNDRYSKDFQKMTISAVCSRVLAAIKYESPPNKSLSSVVTLIRPTEITALTEDDYGISKICKNDVTVHFITGDHFTILENKATADIINTIMT